MEREQRALVRDARLNVEACTFRNVVRPFPVHFHEYPVVGLIERGRRHIMCCHNEYLAGAGCLLLLRPGESHACSQHGAEPLSYRGLLLPAHGAGVWPWPDSADAVLDDPHMAQLVRSIHTAVADRTDSFRTEEMLLLLSQSLNTHCGNEVWSDPGSCRPEVGRASDYMEAHYAEKIGLQDLCRQAAMSKSALLRAFMREKGITPYNYLLSVRVARAGVLLRQGIPLADAAAATGFSDQSHFTNCFTRLTGLSPGCYRNLTAGAARPERI